jgi:tripeptide aminopeptidase
VGEEALGNLRGVKALFAEHPGIDGFISVDGVDSPEQARSGKPGIVTQATGSRRWEFTFNGPGGHSFGNFGNPSAAHALGRAVARIADLRTPAEPKTKDHVQRGRDPGRHRRHRHRLAGPHAGGPAFQQRR